MTSLLADLANLRESTTHQPSAAERILDRLSEVEEFTKPGTANITPADMKKLAPLIKHYDAQPHFFGACVRDQMKHGLSKDHANRRCAVLKDAARGTTKWRSSEAAAAAVNIATGRLRELSEAHGAGPVAELILDASAEPGALAPVAEEVRDLGTVVLALSEAAAKAPGWITKGMTISKPPKTKSDSSSGGSSKFDETKHPRGSGAAGGQFVQSGASGEGVSTIQKRLGIQPSGTFDEATRRAVIAFQRRKGLTVDGVVGAQTVAAMRGGSASAGALTAQDRHYLSTRKAKEAEWTPGVFAPITAPLREGSVSVGGYTYVRDGKVIHVGDYVRDLEGFLKAMPEGHTAHMPDGVKVGKGTVGGSRFVVTSKSVSVPHNVDATPFAAKAVSDRQNFEKSSAEVPLSGFAKGDRFEYQGSTFEYRGKQNDKLTAAVVNKQTGKPATNAAGKEVVSKFSRTANVKKVDAKAGGARIASDARTSTSARDAEKAMTPAQRQAIKDRDKPVTVVKGRKPEAFAIPPDPRSSKPIRPSKNYIDSRDAESGRVTVDKELSDANLSAVRAHAAKNGATKERIAAIDSETRARGGRVTVADQAAGMKAVDAHFGGKKVTSRTSTGDIIAQRDAAKQPKAPAAKPTTPEGWADALARSKVTPADVPSANRAEIIASLTKIRDRMEGSGPMIVRRRQALTDKIAQLKGKAREAERPSGILAPLREWYGGDDPLGRAAQQLHRSGSLYVGAGVGASAKGNQFAVIQGSDEVKVHATPLAATSHAFQLAGAMKHADSPGGMDTIADPARAAHVKELDRRIASAQEDITRLSSRPASTAPSGLPIGDDYSRRALERARASVTALKRQRSQLFRQDRSAATS